MIRIVMISASTRHPDFGGTPADSGPGPESDMPPPVAARTSASAIAQAVLRVSR
ncbi:hypothetical protein ABZY03_10495 [Streptomyces klenkii]|uniref:hypothetical protein n=1 Tax=Streptomyces klenkii TaxID=1420899 RepID=UPI0033A6E5D2